MSLSYGIGSIYTRHVGYLDDDFVKARRLLERHRAPVERLEVGASRADAAAYAGMSEKFQSAPPSTDSLCVRFLGDCRLNGQPMQTAPGCYQVLTAEVAQRIQAEQLLVIENLETFRQLESYPWVVDAIGGGETQVMVLYRGDRDRSVGEMSDFIARRSEPTAVFFDFDPAGLGMAAKVPRMSHLLVPDRGWLEMGLEGARAVSLYAASVGQWQSFLDGCADERIASAWSLMKSRRAGMAQEGMRDAPIRQCY
ncbi:hypothetical protein [Roseateles asaccharophilus]|uniref:DUF7281 domain-containing protein n=1 Tax=Roseateles asaccharophilus TaxID=582607 RepID=UPI003850DA20